jgi:tripartite ATP-independent transporter DctM subunit
MTLVGILGLLAFLVLIFLEVPVGICMGIVGFIGLGIIRGIDPGLNLLGLQYFRTAATYAFSVIPLFVLMGFLASEVKISTDAFQIIEKWLGHVRGGLAMATTTACAIFAAICGDSIATATTLAAVTLPIMRERKYNDILSLGCLASGGNLGFLIPPSLGFVFYAIITEQSIGTLFISGIGPGILLTILFIATIAILCRMMPNLGPPTPAVSWRERFVSLRYILGPVVIIILVLGGIYSGLFTPTEAAAAGVFGCIVFGLVTRRLSWKGMRFSLRESAKLVGRIFILVSGALVFSRFITITEIPNNLADYLSVLNVGPYAILWIVLVFYILAGLILDIMSIILLVAPILHFILVALGFDPVWIASITMITILMGQISPPFGIVVFGLAGYVQDVPIWTIYKGCIPFLIAMLVGLALVVYFPSIALYLPNLMKPDYFG